MNLLPGTQYIEGNGDIAIGTAGKPIRIFSVEGISGGTATTLKLFNGTDTSGQQYAQLDGIANESIIINYAGGKRFPAGCFLQTDANSAYTTVVYTEEF